MPLEESKKPVGNPSYRGTLEELFTSHAKDIEDACAYFVKMLPTADVIGLEKSGRRQTGRAAPSATDWGGAQLRLRSSRDIYQNSYVVHRQAERNRNAGCISWKDIWGHGADEKQDNLDGSERLMPGVFPTPFPYCRTAAIILEPVIGEGGYVPAPASYLKALREIADKHGIMLIFDEVQAGFGRTGKYFAPEYSGVRPDMLVIAKGIANGFPLSGVGGTYAGNAVACAAGVACADVMKEENVLENAQIRWNELLASLDELRESPTVGKYTYSISDARVLVLMIGFEFASASSPPGDVAYRADAPKDMASRVSKKCIEKGMHLLMTSIYQRPRSTSSPLHAHSPLACAPPPGQSATPSPPSLPFIIQHGSQSLPVSLNLVLAFGWLVLRTLAYIPALPTNDSAEVQAGVNESDTSMLKLQWFPNASFAQTVSYQLVGSESSGINKGALVHFSEQDTTNETTTTPWIAFVSCDSNGTDFSMEDDVFTLARDRGAVAALLYSQWSEACIINAEYQDPATFDQVFDIFSTKSLVTARTVENAFTNVNQTLYGNYNAETLNATFDNVTNGISSGQASSGYLLATLTAANASVSDDNDSSDSGSTTASPGNSGGTDLAMIVLYVITGAVSLLFCTVILSGAIRAIRHPERYGPRPADPTVGGEFGQGQSRARGLTRAILDTFPVIKFSRLPVTQRNFGEPNIVPKPPDSESGSGSIQMAELPASRDVPAAGDRSESGNHEEQRTWTSPVLTTNSLRNNAEADGTSSPGAGPSTPPDRGNRAATPDAQETTSSISHAPVNAETSADSNLMPAAIGRETCPICIIDFEEGDDIRVLPCEGRHVFHQTCVDQWLLELSSSCPICRHDFHALEEMIASGDAMQEDREDTHGRHSSHMGSRFSRYLRFARGRRVHHNHRLWGNRDDITEDPTDPPMPMARDTTLSASSNA
ncbi:hypothetical protein ACEPAF_7631 [Sanghuangporus sanghuang]